jgi:L-ascorbate metabolism protein UlaG (beta-lactamase superfamily)
MSRVSLRFLGNSAFEILSEKGVRILIDPHIRGNQLCPISLDDLEPADLILVSHAAKDHMSDAPELARNFQCPVICDPAVAYFLKSQGGPDEKIISMVWGQVFPYRGLKVRALESKHISFFRNGPIPITGLPLGFILYTESDLRIYHSGDTSIFSGLELFGELYRPDIGLILVGNYPGALAELSPEEAAMAVKWLRLKVAIPMHYEKGSAEPQQFVESVKRQSPRTQAIIMEPGEWRYFKIADFFPTASEKPE